MMSGSSGLPDQLPPNKGKGQPRRADDRRPSQRGGQGSNRASGNTGASGLSNPPGLNSLLSSFQRHLPLALSLGLILGTLASAAVWMLYKVDLYTTKALLVVSANTPTISRSNTQVVEDPTQYGNYQTTQLTYIRGRLVLNAALKTPVNVALNSPTGGDDPNRKIADLPIIAQQADPIEWLSTNLKTYFMGEVLSISLQGNDPNQIIAIVNAVMEAYLKEVVNVERDTRKERYYSLEKMANSYQEELTATRKRLRDLAQTAGSNNSGTLAIKQQLKLDEIAELSHTLGKTRTELRESRTELSLMDPSTAEPNDKGKAAAPIVNPARVAAEVSKNPDVIAASHRVDEIKQAVAHNRAIARNPSDPANRRAQEELHRAQDALDSIVQTVRRDLIRQYAAQPGGATKAASDLDLLKKKIDYLTTYEEELRQEMTRLQGEDQALTNNSIDLEESRDRIAMSTDKARRLRDEADRLKMELDAPARIRPMERAVTAQPLTIKKKIGLTAMAGLGSLGLVLASFTLWDVLARRVNHADDVVRSLGIDLVGVLPALPNRSERRALARRRPGAWEHVLMESVDATRTMLLHASRTEQLRSVMITSAVKGEGKTSLSSHLATSLARARQRTLLIDGDLRSPTLHTLFDLPRGPGFSELLRGEIDLADALQASPAPSLTLITAGQVDSEAIAALAEGRLNTILDELRQQYDFILIDSAPLLPVADSLLLSQHVDAVIFSVLREVSCMPKIQAAYDRLLNLNVRILGAVLAGARSSSSYYHKDYYSYSSVPAKADRDPNA